MSADVIQFGDASKRFELAFEAYELASSCICAANNITADAGVVWVQKKYRQILQEEFPRLFEDRGDREPTAADQEECRQRMDELESEFALVLTTFIERKIAELFASPHRRIGSPSTPA